MVGFQNCVGFVGLSPMLQQRRPGERLTGHRQAVVCMAKRRKGKKSKSGGSSPAPKADKPTMPVGKSEKPSPQMRAEAELSPEMVKPAQPEEEVSKVPPAAGAVPSMEAGDDFNPKPDTMDFQGPLSPDEYTNKSKKPSNRRRRRRSKKKVEDPVPVDLTSAEEGTVEASVRQLTSSFAMNKESLKEQIQVDPDFVISQKDATPDYDLAASFLGRGSKSEEFGYILPYLQTGHMVGLAVVLLTANIYYPGFPLTQLSEEVRDGLRKGLLLIYAFNAVLAVLTYFECQKRRQPWTFWVPKVLLLGGLAFNELRDNIPLAAEERESGGSE
mmetsp:Transcript_4900/g.21087  ORF Transcript_4900/g.21087 Transcript_4900/m.21087 type:complete len:328 (-) Transcript_4900:1412-2395(-)|eukprot:CAMPEP_0113966510 /NCGR_PEP_ID=MMETSP0011_2-20120614/8367_1 /TAXON_ID=101924 /ORGANISM="Rhodosorus marinus" /LENGTH=327 /DNA_ID=CAMNT_0000979195 /DNA_START=796 /DNA_END=1779 /DNA_ORIENTATION=- /assembly_acc=CAM_ASM_000156